MSIIAFTVV